MVENHKLNAVVPSINSSYLIPNIVEITNSILSAADKYFAVIDLAYMFCSILISTAPQLQFTFNFRGHNTPLLDLS